AAETVTPSRRAVAKSVTRIAWAPAPCASTLLSTRFRAPAAPHRNTPFDRSSEPLALIVTRVPLKVAPQFSTPDDESPSVLIVESVRVTDDPVSTRTP